MAGYDPFEKAFIDYQQGNHKAKITVYNNKGDDEQVPVGYFFRDFDEMPEQEQIALSLCSGRILDIGAGSGCHSLVLQERGFDVTALDIRAGFVKVMKKRGLKRIVHADILNYNGGPYDTLLMLMNGAGIAGSLKGLELFLNHANNLLASGGQIILDSSDLMYLQEIDDGSYLIDFEETYYGEIVYQIEYNGIKGEPFNWLFVDYPNLEQIASDCGFIAELLFEGPHFNYIARLY